MTVVYVKDSNSCVHLREAYFTLIMIVRLLLTIITIQLGASQVVVDATFPIGDRREAITAFTMALAYDKSTVAKTGVYRISVMVRKTYPKLISSMICSTRGHRACIFSFTIFLMEFSLMGIKSCY